MQFGLYSNEYIVFVTNTVPTIYIYSLESQKEQDLLTFITEKYLLLTF